MKSYIPLILLPLAGLFGAPAPIPSPSSVAPARPLLHMHIVGGEEDENDRELKAAYESHYDIKMLGESPDYVQSRLVSGSRPRANDAKGKAIRGFVLLGYVVTESGRGERPVILKSTESRLDGPARQLLATFQFKPATWTGAAIRSAAVTPLYFESDEIPPVEIPTEFIMRELMPFHGRVNAPKDWFFRQRGYAWIISKEDSEYGQAYLTGMKIEFFPGVKKHSGQTAEATAVANYRRLRGLSKSVVRTWEPTRMGLFTRYGIELEDDRFHVIYSFFYDNDLDMMVVSTVGAPKSQWEAYSPTFGKMTDFTLMDLEAIRRDRDGRKSGDAEADGADDANPETGSSDSR